nr:MAG TPA: hypothetical protein [Caudoviricetes sp.]
MFSVLCTGILNYNTSIKVPYSSSVASKLVDPSYTKAQRK